MGEILFEKRLPVALIKTLFACDLGVSYQLLLLFCFTASIGKLRICVPWKKLGWEPILISLEDVTICAGPQDDGEVCFEGLYCKFTTLVNVF